MAMGTPRSTRGTMPRTYQQAMFLLAVLCTVISASSQQPRHIFGESWWPKPNKPIPQYSWPSKCFPTPQCDPTYPYRSLDGSCNNLWMPAFGMANTTLVRLLEVSYSDDKGSLPISVLGGPLPPARVLHNLLFPDHPISDSVNSLAVSTWTQFLTHDVSLIMTRILGDCCTKDGRTLPVEEVPSNCLVIDIPEDDPFYSRFGQTCFALARSGTINSEGCNTYPLQQINMQTSYLDLSMVYGKNQKESDSLRSFVRGRLKTQEDEDGRQFLPNVPDATKNCPFASSATDTCFFGGDVRLNQQPPLTALHTIALREHNLLCDQLYLLNRHWSDERIFQEARRLNIAQYQHITFAHVLPIILGEESTAFYKLTPSTIGYGFGYNEEVNPGTMNMFTTAAFRAFHSIVPDHVEFPMEAGQCPQDSRPLVDVMNRPSVLVEDDNLDSVLRALFMQAAFQMDHFFTEQISNMLFRPANREFGFDLISTDMMRGRDHGLPTFNRVREACGLGRATDFHEFGDTMSKKSWMQLKEVYAHVDDVDLYVGGIMEELVPGALVGRVFQCIIAEQFRRFREGDRFFYEFGGQPGSFRLDQLEEIKKTSLSLLICRNSDRIKKVTRDAFSQPSSRNPLIKCRDIPSLNLRLWKE